MPEEEGSQPWATFPKTLHCPAQDSGGHRVQDTAAADQHLLQDSTGWCGAVLTAGCGVRQIWAGAQPTSLREPRARCLTLFSAPPSVTSTWSLKLKRGNSIHSMEIKQVLLQFRASVFPGELAAKHLLAHHLFVNLQGSRIMLGW